jgi:hypothetical protein
VFNGAFCYEALHHLPQPHKEILEALRVSDSFTLGDEPAKFPIFMEFIMIKLLKPALRNTESSGYESYRFDPGIVKGLLKRSGYSVPVKRQWTYVPKIFTRFEKSSSVVTLYLSLYALMMKYFISSEPQLNYSH